MIIIKDCVAVSWVFESDCSNRRNNAARLTLDRIGSDWIGLMTADL